MTKVFRVQDAVEVGFPGARTIIRTYREVWQTRRCDLNVMSAMMVARSPRHVRRGLEPLNGQNYGRGPRFRAIRLAGR